VFASLRVLASLPKDRASGAPAVLIVCASAIPVLLFGFQVHTRGSPLFSSPRWNVDADRSYIEILGYGFVLAAAGLLLALALRRRVPVYGGWAAALTVVAADDALEGHERAGSWLSRSFPGLDPPGLRVEDVGELLAWGLVGAVVSVGVHLTHRRSAPDARRDSVGLAWLMGLLMVFAVGVDMLHIALKGVFDVHWLNMVLISIEGAGEVGVTAVVLAFALHVSRGPALETPAASVELLVGRPNIDRAAA
jgi:hypothetical protein